FFFFSSRRRHTRFSRDWSSDVCSSDLMGDEALGIPTACWYSAEFDNPINQKFAAAFREKWKYDPGFYAAATYTEAAVLEATLNRSEERRVGKEGRSRWWTSRQ